MGDLQTRNLHLPPCVYFNIRETASAAELLTNNLAPYTNVIRIGETTYGKDEAAFPIEDHAQPAAGSLGINACCL